MLLLLLLTLGPYSVLCAQDIKDYDFNQFAHLFENLIEYRPGDVTAKDVTFYLFTRNGTPNSAPLSDLDTTRDTKMVIHGYMDNRNRSWYQRLTDEYLKNADVNVIQVDWARVAMSSYPSTVLNTKVVGRLVAKFILDHQLPPTKTHLIGHSLGAHISAFAAQIVKKRTGVKISRITALDPAGPGFHNEKKKNRLDSNDADVVDVIHTDGNLYGSLTPIGTFDIYFNGGVGVQPDCIKLDVSSVGKLLEGTYCSHTRSYVHFIEMINNVKYSCNKCGSWLRYKLGFCTSNEKYVFGAEDINAEMRGLCFVDT